MYVQGALDHVACAAPTRCVAILELERVEITRFLHLLQRQLRLGGFAEVVANRARPVNCAGRGALIERQCVGD